ncbi:hypothetical protein X474_19680 [Dethiosulfatarculus sandiegensis]|uniref:Uncharacterized protein n=1 Tax=Dethiosulfatarculus sandiegensis TaxID=1429043 RepID=A0A0D2GBJ4_9BACT|nr:hypothetical protein X474_19680 [Dethiosulfatarculus sandiegensis]
MAFAMELLPVLLGGQEIGADPVIRSAPDLCFID